MQQIRSWHVKKFPLNAPIINNTVGTGAFRHTSVLFRAEFILRQFKSPLSVFGGVV